MFGSKFMEVVKKYGILNGNLQTLKSIARRSENKGLEKREARELEG